MQITAPTYTQTPNDLIDHWLPLLKGSEVKVLLVVIRKTFGFHKAEDIISISQLSTITGLTKKLVIEATKTLQKKGLIHKEVTGKNGTQITHYKLIVHEDSNNSYQCQKDTPPSVKKEPTKQRLPKKDSSYRRVNEEESLTSDKNQKKKSFGQNKNFQGKAKFTEEQKVAYDWLRSLGINTDDDTLSWWARTYSLERLDSVYRESKNKSSVGAYMNTLLRKGSIVSSGRIEINKEYCEAFKFLNKWSLLEVYKKYAKVSRGSMSEEITFDMEPSMFREYLERKYESL